MLVTENSATTKMPHYVKAGSNSNEQTKTLTMTANSVRNTTMSTEDDFHYYDIVTRFWHPKVTKINILDPDTQVLHTVAEVEKVGMTKDRYPKHRVRFVKSPDIIVPIVGGTGNEKDIWSDWIPGEQFLRVDDPEKVGGYLVHDGVEYRWKTHNRHLQLVRADDPEKKPLVIYRPYHRYFFVFRMSRHATLEFKPELGKLLDRLIVSYILVERRRRAHNRAL